MADKDKLERTYNVPLRKKFLKVPRYKRTNKAVSALREFLVKHMKCEDIKIGPHLNTFLWKDGIKNPPHHVKVNAVRKDGKVFTELFGKSLKFNETKEETTEKSNKLEDALGKTEEKVKKEEVKTEKTVETKEEKKPKLDKVVEKEEPVKEQTKAEKKVEEKTIEAKPVEKKEETPKTEENK